jgi:hypothetical protein
MLIESRVPLTKPRVSHETRAGAGLAEDLSAPASSSGRWFFRRPRSPAGAVAVNARRAPRLGSPPPSGRSVLEGPRQFFPTDSFSLLEDPLPVQSKTGAMPANHSFRNDNEERLLPFRPEPAREHPKRACQKARVLAWLACASVARVTGEAPSSPAAVYAVNESNGPTALKTAAKS